MAEAEAIWQSALITRLEGIEPVDVKRATVWGRTLLHRAVQDEAVCHDAEFLNRLVDLFPEALNTKQHTDGRTPLHVALSSTACEVLLRRGGREGICQSRDFRDLLPLHAICAKNCRKGDATDRSVSPRRAGKLSTEESARIISLIVEAYPAALRERDKGGGGGSLPLHYALRTSQSPHAIAMLLSAYPEAASMSDDLVKVKPQKSSLPESAASPLDVVARLQAPTSTSLGDDRLPLHIALQRVSSDICWHSVILLARTFPPAVSVPCPETGLFPLCCALTSRAPATVVSCLLDIFPSAVLSRFAKRNGMGKTSPLLVAIENCASHRDANNSDGDDEDSQSIVKLVLKAFPEGLFDSGAEGQEFPVESMLRMRLWSLVDYSLMAFLDLVKQSSKSKHSSLSAFTSTATDLVAFCLQHGAPVSTLYLAIKTNPATVRQTRPDSLQLPLHLAVSNFSSHDAVSLLLELFPEASTTQDFFGMLPVHIAVQRSQPGVIASILNSCPSCANAPDATGRRAVDILLQSAFARSPSRAYMWREFFEASPESAGLHSQPSSALPQQNQQKRPRSPSLARKQQHRPIAPLFQALAAAVPFECLAELMLHSLPVLHTTRQVNQTYCGQLHDLLADPCLDDSFSATPDETITAKSALYTRLIEHALDDLEIAHTIAHSRHPFTKHSALECCSDRFRPLLLERMWLWGRYKQSSSDPDKGNVAPSSPPAAVGTGHRAVAAASSPVPHASTPKSKPRTKSTSKAQVHIAADGTLFWSIFCLDLNELRGPPRPCGLLMFESYGLWVIETLQVSMVPPLLLRTHTVTAAAKTKAPNPRRQVELQLLDRLLCGAEGEAERVTHAIAVDVKSLEELQRVTEPIIRRLSSGEVGELRPGASSTSSSFALDGSLPASPMCQSEPEDKELANAKLRAEIETQRQAAEANARDDRENRLQAGRQRREDLAQLLTKPAEASDSFPEGAELLHAQVQDPEPEPELKDVEVRIAEPTSEPDSTPSTPVRCTNQTCTHERINLGLVSPLPILASKPSSGSPVSPGSASPLRKGKWRRPGRYVGFHLASWNEDGSREDSAPQTVGVILCEDQHDLEHCLECSSVSTALVHQISIEPLCAQQQHVLEGLAGRAAGDRICGALILRTAGLRELASVAEPLLAGLADKRE